MLGRRYGPYEVVGELARGAQGVVLRARHAGTGAPAALKLLLRPTDRGLRRFRQEVAILERIQHPNLVKVLAHGEEDGAPWVAMELVQGESLRQRVEARGRLPAPEAAATLAAVARAVQACHDQGIVHRDVKPENIIVEASTGRPVLVDLGLARRDREVFGALSIDDRSRLSVTGELRGTPAFMAPEQIAPDTWGEVGPLTDVYSLGVTLFVALTGEQPVEADSLPGLIRTILEEPPRDPRALARDVPEPLARACREAMAKAQAERPPSAEAFAAALLAPPDRPGRTGLALAAGLALLVGAGVAVALVGRTSRPPEGPVPPTTPDTGSSTTSPELPAPELPAWTGPIARGSRGALRLRRVHGAHDDLHVDHVWSLAFSPDERRLLSGTGFWSHTSPGVVTLRAVDEAAELRSWRAHASTVTGVAFSADGRRGVSASRDGEVRLWDLGPDAPAGAPPLSRLGGAPVVGFAPLDPDLWAVVRTDGAVSTVRRVGDALRVEAQRQVVGPVAFGVGLSGGRRVVVDGAPVVLLDLDTGEPWPVANKRLDLVAAAADPAGQLLYAASHDGRVTLFDLVAAESRTLPGRTRGEATFSAAWVPGTRRVLRGRFDGKVALVDAQTGEDVRAWEVRPSLWGVAAVAVTHDGRRAAVGAGDGRLALVDLADPGRGPVIRFLGPPAAPGALPGRVERLACAPGGGVALLGYLGGREAGAPVATLLDLRTGARTSLATGLLLVRGVGLARDVALVAGDGGVLQVWDLRRPAAPPRLLGPSFKGGLSGAALSPDGRTAAACSDAGELWVAPADGTRPGTSFPAAERGYAGLAFTPGGALVAVASVWNEEAAELVRHELPAGEAQTTPVPFATTVVAPLGEDEVVLGGQRGQVQRWSLRGGAGSVHPSHDGTVLALAVSPDRSRVASAGGDGWVRLSDARSGAELDALDLGLTGDRAHALVFAGPRLLVGTARGLLLELEGSP